MLSESYAPTIRRTTVNGESSYVDHRIKTPLENMFLAAKKDGLNLYLKSAYRPYSNQKAIFKRRSKNAGLEHANNYIAIAGASEHQLGLAVDVISTKFKLLNDKFAKTPEGEWIAENAHKYGFIIRYQKEHEAVTGINFEPWHLRYVGEETAKILHDLQNPPLENYLSKVKLNLYLTLLGEE